MNIFPENLSSLLSGMEVRKNQNYYFLLINNRKLYFLERLFESKYQLKYFRMDGFDGIGIDIIFLF